MSRPPEKDREIVRTVYVKVRLRPRQRKRWEAKARALSMTLSDWLRMVADRDARMQ
jgi:hypothetical protein